MAESATTPAEAVDGPLLPDEIEEMKTNVSTWTGLPGGMPKAQEAFAQWAKTALPRLIGEVERLNAEVASLKAEMSTMWVADSYYARQGEET